VNGYAFEGIEEAQAPADIAGLLTNAPIGVDELAARAASGRRRSNRRCWSWSWRGGSHAMRAGG